MADPILLPDCPELRERAYSAMAARRDRTDHAQGRLDRMHCGPGKALESAVSIAALAELRDLSTPTGRDHACRWLWALLTGDEPEWCPGWRQFAGAGYVLELRGVGRINVTNSGVDGPSGTVCEFAPGEFFVSIDRASSLTPTEALAAAIVAALDWRRGQP